jgi:flavin-dependent dehydrogenase
MGRLAQREGATIATQTLFRSIRRDGDRSIVEVADLARGTRREIAARSVFLANGATARLDGSTAFSFDRWSEGLMTTLQYRVYLDTPAVPVTYRTLELHYYPAADGRMIVAWMFPKRDHLAIGLGLVGKLAGAPLRAALDAFTERVRTRLYPHARVTAVKQEGHLLYGGLPRPRLADGTTMLGGTAAGLVDATNGEGIFEAAMSGRLAAAAIAANRHSRETAAMRYAREAGARFTRRLTHRVKLMHFLESRPARFALLFEQLSGSPRFADALQKEDHERTVTDRLFLYAQALRFGLRAARA